MGGEQTVAGLPGTSRSDPCAERAVTLAEPDIEKKTAAIHVLQLSSRIDLYRPNQIVKSEIWPS